MPRGQRIAPSSGGPKPSDRATEISPELRVQIMQRPHGAVIEVIRPDEARSTAGPSYTDWQWNAHWPFTERQGSGAAGRNARLEDRGSTAVPSTQLFDRPPSCNDLINYRMRLN